MKILIFSEKEQFEKCSSQDIHDAELILIGTNEVWQETAYRVEKNRWDDTGLIISEDKVGDYFSRVLQNRFLKPIFG